MPGWPPRRRPFTSRPTSAGRAATTSRGRHLPRSSAGRAPTLLHFEAEVGGQSRHNESGTTFVEIFSWSRPDAPQLAHNTPAVMAVWEPMGALVEARDGRPAMEFPNYRPLNLDA